MGCRSGEQLYTETGVEANRSQGRDHTTLTKPKARPRSKASHGTVCGGETKRSTAPRGCGRLSVSPICQAVPSRFQGLKFTGEASD
jgi:hypothetical protein